MIKKIRTLALSLAFVAQSVSAEVVSDIPSTAIEESDFVIKGKKLDAPSNPLTVSIRTSDGTVLALTPTIIDKTRASVRMPSVAADTKVVLQVSGGNVPASSPQRFVVLVIDRPDIAGLDTQGDGPALPDSVSSDIHASTADSATVVTGATQAAITSLPSIGTLGAVGNSVIIPGALVVSGGIGGTATAAGIVNAAAQPAITTLANFTNGGTAGVNTLFKGKIIAAQGVNGNVIGNLTGNVTGNVTGNLTGTASDVANSAVIAKTLTAFGATTGAITNGDSLLSAIQKLVGNLASVNGDVDSHTTSLASISTSLSGKQDADATLTGLAGVSTSANKLIYANGSDTFATTDLTVFGRSLIDDANGVEARATLGLGTAALSAVGDFQPIDSDLTAYAATGVAADVANSAVIGKTLTGFSSTTGTITNGDSLLSAIQKLVGNLAVVNGNVTTNTSSIATHTTDISSLNSGKQNVDATLTALAGVTTAADKLIYANGSDTFATTDFTTFGRTLVATADAAAAQSALGLGTAALAAATSFQAADTDLTAFAAKTAPTGAVVGTTDNQALTTKTLQDSTVSFVDNTDATKAIKFELSGLTTATTHTITVPDVSGTVTLLGNTATGTGDVVLATSATLVTPNIGAATGTSLALTGIGAFGGGFGSTGVTISSTGSIQADGDLTVSGTATATAFSGPLTGNVTGDLAGRADTALAGVIDIAVAKEINDSWAVVISEANVIKVIDSEDAQDNKLALITGGIAGQFLTVIFSDAITVVDDDTPTAGSINIGAQTAYAAGDTLVLIYDGAGWYEIAHSLNN